ncbi:MAG: DUF3015 domain-containing protein [Gammaproteobacteria bacterium]|nr:DUF3015 domain-containing protein [Gammaproteobacteria bacterium]
MKKIILSALVGVMYAGSATAAPNNVGCGLGSMFFEGSSGVMMQSLAATTNGIAGNQTFGITSGTLGCAKDGVVQKYAAADAFMGANVDKVARDMSVGQGEALETLADAMGIKDADKARFFEVAKANFDAIYTSASITSDEVLVNLGKVMANDDKLAAYTA